MKPNGCYCVYYPSNIFLQGRILHHVMCLDQSRARKIFDGLQSRVSIDEHCVNLVNNTNSL